MSLIINGVSQEVQEARRVKLKNKRVFLVKGTDSYLLVFKRLGESRREIVKTQIALSYEAMDALVKAYDVMNRPGGAIWLDAMWEALKGGKP